MPFCLGVLEHILWELCLPSLVKGQRAVASGPELTGGCAAKLTKGGSGETDNSPQYELPAKHQTSPEAGFGV